jgi:hypothetical protein
MKHRYRYRYLLACTDALSLKKFKEPDSGSCDDDVLIAFYSYSIPVPQQLNGAVTLVPVYRIN